MVLKLNLDYLAIVFGLSAAASFGMGDFTGGYTTKKTNVFLVLLYSQIVGALFLIVSILFIGEQLSFTTIIFSTISGIFGGIGLLAFYRGLSLGNMGIVAPITAVVTPIIPLLYSFLNLKYTIGQIVGIILAFIAIWLVSSSKLEKKITYDDVTLAILAGIGFGVFLLFIDLASTTTSVLYPILIARLSSLVLIICATTYFGKFEKIDPKIVGLSALAGILDTLGNLFFVFSSKSGRLDFATILLSMGPVVTVLLAWKLLHEHLTKTQLVGIALSVIAVSLLSA